MADTCVICGARGHSEVYRGPIRHGGFGSNVDGVILQCPQCGVRGLDEQPQTSYQSGEYRRLVNADNDVETYRALHDPLQARYLDMVGVDRLRDRVVMDVGCAGGSFLDMASGVAARAAGIEPDVAFQASLKQRGYRVFSDCRAARGELQGAVDYAVCFSVIEHVADPVELLTEIRELLAPTGELLLSTPNANDWLLELLPDAYPSFFYRTVHRWYFTAEALRHTAQRAGFREIDVTFWHRFDLSNLLLWLRDRRPTGLAHVPVAPPLDAAFRATLETAGTADYLVARLRP